jgi:DNA-binding response OmpR family regulator
MSSWWKMTQDSPTCSRRSCTQGLSARSGRLMTKARAVVLDLVLPGLPGEDFLRALRASRGAGIPVVVVTLKDLDPAANRSLQKAGVTAVLRKGPGTAATAANLIASRLASELVAI